MTRHAVALTGLLAAVVAQGADAQEGRLSADVAATAGYSNNPFAVVGSDTGSAVASIDVQPRYQLLMPRSTLTISGDVAVQQYLRRYSSNDSYAAALDYQLRPSARLTAHARLDFSSAVLGSYNNYQPSFVSAGTAGATSSSGTAATGVIGATGIAPLDPVVGTQSFTDIALYGLRNRRTLGGISGDVTNALSARDTLTVSGYAQKSWYDNGAQLGNYTAYSGSLGYSRRLSDRVSVGLRGSASFFDYEQNGVGTRSFPVEATLSARLSKVWTVDGGIGATIVDGGSVGSTRRTSLSGNVNLCRGGLRSTMCAQASRQVQPTGLVGSQYVTAGAVNWSNRLNERDTVSLNASYSKVGGDNRTLSIGGLPVQSEYVQAGASYDRRISRRLRLVVSGNYGELLNGNVNRPNDFGGRLGLTYRLGDPR